MTYLPMSCIVLLSLSHRAQQGEVFAPHGCTYSNSAADCDFQKWIPPLNEEDFVPKPVQNLILNNINGTIPAEGFSGLYSVKSMLLNCDNHNTRLSRSIFTSNLQRVEFLRIEDCFLDNGLTSGLFENLKSLKYLQILSGGIEGLVACDTFVGLKILQSIYIRAPVENATLPSDLFAGLVKLDTIDLRAAMLDSIPSNWFSGLVRLSSIFLMENNLQTLPLGLFDDLELLTSVWLRDNPWHCSCGLVWLLDWSNVTKGGACNSPVRLQRFGLQYALSLLNCTPSTPAVLTSPSSSKTEITDTRASPFTTPFTGSLVSSKAPSSRQDLMALTSTLTQKPFVISKKYSSVPLIVTAIPTPRTTPIASTMSSLTTSTVSWSATRADVTGATDTALYLSSVLMTDVMQCSLLHFDMQTVYYSITNQYVDLLSRKTDDGILNNLKNIIVISGVSALTVLLFLAIVLHRCVLRNQCIGSVSPMADEERNRHDPGSHIRNTAGPF